MATSDDAPLSKEKVLSIILPEASKVFGRPVTETDNFFDLGGDSLSALELGDRLSNALRAQLDIEVMLDAEDMNVLAERVARSLWSAGAGAPATEVIDGSR
jgi:acyl carrier protein